MPFLWAALLLPANGEDAVHFQTRFLDRSFYCEGAAVGDFNKDGHKDVVSGPFWYAGPDFNDKHTIYKPNPFDPKGYSKNFLCFVADFDTDGWDDVFVVGFPGDKSWWFENPGADGGEWKQHVTVEVTDNESPLVADLTGDSRPELIFHTGGRYGYAGPDPANPRDVWKFHPVSEKIAGGRFQHGLGIGDVNGDGRMDVLAKDGWLEQPESLVGDPMWKRHMFPFAPTQGGAQMYAYDFDGDGDNDVLTSLQAHGYGLVWYENKPGDDGIAFTAHTIIGKNAEESVNGVIFTQMHSIDLKDISGDGVLDIVTGKRYFAHGGKDPGGMEPPVLYWYETKRTGRAGEMGFVPHFIHHDSGVGTQVMAEDLNGDKLLDIIVGNKKGTAIHLQGRHKTDQEGFFSIFDGKTLQGWDGDKRFWRVEDGAITGEWTPEKAPEGNTFVFWRDGALADFELRLQYRIDNAKGNSGVQFRAVDTGNYTVKGYQADLEAGPTWLGRIYDEHGRALLAERGCRVLISEDGKRQEETFATPAALMEHVKGAGEWNDYHIIASGEHITVKVNDKVMSELVDRQKGERDLYGLLAFQLHRMAPVKVQFRNIRLKPLPGVTHKVDVRKLEQAAVQERPGIVPKGESGKNLNLGFEEGTLRGWTATGNAFAGQPIEGDKVAARRQDMRSNHEGRYWIGGFEKHQDPPQGTLVSDPIKVTHPWASFLFAGDSSELTRAEVRLAKGNNLLGQATGSQTENLNPFVVDLRKHQGKEIVIRLVDEHSGHWGHLNYDDFRFHNEKPEGAPLGMPAKKKTAADAVAAMTVPDGFTVDLLASEPDLLQPIAFTFDGRGRLWIVEGHTYPRRAPEGQGRDKVLIFSDEDANGSFETRKVFMEGLNLVSGIEVGFGGVWIGAAPNLLFVPDRNGDDKPDGKPEILLDGWGYHDTHETLNAFVWGPDGWLYGCHGVFTHSLVGKPGTAKEDREPLNCGYWRYHPTRHEFEVFAWGTSNPWGIDFNDYGQAFATACVIPHFWHVIQGARYLRQSNPLGHFSPYVYKNIETIADHVHYIGATPHAGNNKSDSAGGGHAHCGLTIYLGDSFPDEFRNKPIFFNLHGHRMNVENLERRGSGYVARHAPDFIKSNDEQFMGVAVKYGPDGGLYFIDWHDIQTCHRTLPEIWDRSNGRLYHVRYGELRKEKVDLGRMHDVELARLQLHKNDWFVRMARRLLQERAANGGINGESVALLRGMLGHDDVTRRLRALWALHVTNNLDESELFHLLEDDSEWMRAWAVQLLMEKDHPGIEGKLVEMAETDRSPLVRLYLASALQRLPWTSRWGLAQALASHAGDADDHNLPQMIWYGIEPIVMEEDFNWAMELAVESAIPLIRRHIVRRASVVDQGVEAVLSGLRRFDDEGDAREVLSELVRSLELRPGVEPPGVWDRVYEDFSKHKDKAVRDLIGRVAVRFGDRRAFPDLRILATDKTKSTEERLRALKVLIEGGDEEATPLLLELTKEKPLRKASLLGLTGRQHPNLASTLFALLPDCNQEEKRAAISALVARAHTADLLLGELETGRVPRTDVSAFAARQILALDDGRFKERLFKHWGTISEDSREDEKTIADLKKKLGPKTLANANLPNGRHVYNQVCACCHTLFGEGLKIGPDLTGSNRANIDYILENIITPSAVVGKDYQLSQIILKNKEIVAGMVRRETEEALEVQLLDNSRIIAKKNIITREVLPISMMPAGLLAALDPDRVRDLIAYLGSPAQVPLPGEGPFLDPKTGKVDGAMEGEGLKVFAKSGGDASPQDMRSFKLDRWSGDHHLWWTGAKPGDRLDLAFQVESPGEYEVLAVMTKAPDYGIVDLELDGKRVVESFDLFEKKGVITTGPVSLGHHVLEKGGHKFSALLKGANKDAAKSYMFALDYLYLKKAG